MLMRNLSYDSFYNDDDDNNNNDKLLNSYHTVSAPLVYRLCRGREIIAIFFLLSSNIVTLFILRLKLQVFLPQYSSVRFSLIILASNVF